MLKPKSETFYFTLNLYLVVALLAFATLDYGLWVALYAALGLTTILMVVVLALVFKRSETDTPALS